MLWAEADDDAFAGVGQRSAGVDVLQARQRLELGEDLLEDTVWTPKSAAQAVETMVEGVWSRLYYSAAYMSVEEALLAVGLLLSTMFPARCETIMKKAAVLRTTTRVKTR